MKYSDVINFNEITSVIKLDSIKDQNKAKNLVKTYIFSKRMQEDVNSQILRNLNYNQNSETKGIQIVGNYGTGKSHLMAVISSIAENADLLNEISDNQLKENMKNIAGKFKVLQIDIGSDRPLKEIIFLSLEKWLNEDLDIKFQFITDATQNYKDMIFEMMAAFQEKYPDKGILLVIDEMLAYLKSRDNTQLNSDLIVLQKVGEACDSSSASTRFRFMFGVQELLYQAPEFQFQAEMLNKVEDRYDDLIITKEDVAFVVKNRLLKKDEHQKANIRKHIEKFSYLYEDLHNNFNEYVEMYPVHPAYIENFSQIKHGKSQREILKTLSNHFKKMLDNDIPTNNPGIITFDSYWIELSSNPSMLSIPDIRKTKEVIETIYTKIESYFSGARASKKENAYKITNALGIKLLQGDINQQNGCDIKTLKDHLFLSITGVNEANLLEEALESTVAKGLVNATNGQFFCKKEDSNEYHIRIEGGVNYDVLIEERAKTLSEDQCDQAFFDFLQLQLQLSYNTYRTGFKIWEHTIDWKDKKTFRNGYVFFGNPDEKSTTQPIQSYYIYFMPIFSGARAKYEQDEVYFDMKDLSKDFKELIKIYGAAKMLEVSSSSDQKGIYKSKIEELSNKARKIFDSEYIRITKVKYCNDEKLLQTYQLPGFGSSKEMIFTEVASLILNNYFNNKFPEYPIFKNLLSPIAKDNFERRIKSALTKIINPMTSNKDGEAILDGLGLLSTNGIDTQYSKYANILSKKLKDKGQGQVLNRDDILYCHYAPTNLWYGKDFNLEYQLVFLILCVLVYKGEIEIAWTGKTINAASIGQINNLTDDDFFSFKYIKQPAGISYESVKTLFQCLGLPDYTQYLDTRNDIYIEIIKRVRDMIEKTLKARNVLNEGIKCRNVSLIDDKDVNDLKDKIDKLKDILDKIEGLNNYGKIRNFSIPKNDLIDTFETYKSIDKIEKLKEISRIFEEYIKYIEIAFNYALDITIMSDLEEVLDNYGKILKSNDDSKIKNFETKIKALKDRYTDEYIKNYIEYLLSQQDGFKRDELMQSNIKKICDIFRDTDIIPMSNYKNWVDKITKLKIAKQITKKEVLESPYHDFNPRDIREKEKPNIIKYKQELEEIYSNVEKSLKHILSDQSVTNNISLLENKDKTLIENFKNKKAELSLENAEQIRNIILTLSKGLDKIEIDYDEIKNLFQAPLTPDDAINLFTEIVNEKIIGKERRKVRIIIK
ncbi:hypothetical protein KAZ01_01605 [Candidatus Gracilibacteria bacterium]|nr:hypothetical protein [Candidatus Gracilibacteria bacterium]